MKYHLCGKRESKYAKVNNHRYCENGGSIAILRFPCDEQPAGNQRKYAAAHPGGSGPDQFCAQPKRAQPDYEKNAEYCDTVQHEQPSVGAFIPRKPEQVHIEVLHR